ncbi:MAG: hypothetical protein KAH18_02830, partial [Psychromonas sp.]|nr:hypothetical protein [Psychromonas sp.]
NKDQQPLANGFTYMLNNKKLESDFNSIFKITPDDDKEPNSSSINISYNKMDQKLEFTWSQKMKLMRAMQIVSKVSSTAHHLLSFKLNPSLEKKPPINVYLYEIFNMHLVLDDAFLGMLAGVVESVNTALNSHYQVITFADFRQPIFRYIDNFYSNITRIDQLFPTAEEHLKFRMQGGSGYCIKVEDDIFHPFISEEKIAEMIYYNLIHTLGTGYLDIILNSAIEFFPKIILLMKQKKCNELKSVLVSKLEHEKREQMRHLEEIKRRKNMKDNDSSLLRNCIIS